jgi:hypothetical protein
LLNPFMILKRFCSARKASLFAIAGPSTFGLFRFDQSRGNNCRAFDNQFQLDPFVVPAILVH